MKLTRFNLGLWVAETEPMAKKHIDSFSVITLTARRGRLKLCTTKCDEGVSIFFTSTQFYHKKEVISIELSILCSCVVVLNNNYF